MAIVHLTTQGSKAALDNHRLVVIPPEGALRRIPLSQVSHLVVWGNITLTTPLLGALLDQGVEIVFLTRHGRFRGRLHAHDTPHVALRRAQYAALENPAWVLTTARAIVRAKLQHQLNLLRRYVRRRGTMLEAVTSAIHQIQKRLHMLGRKRKVVSRFCGKMERPFWLDILGLRTPLCGKRKNCFWGRGGRKRRRGGSEVGRMARWTPFGSLQSGRSEAFGGTNEGLGGRNP